MKKLSLKAKIIISILAVAFVALFIYAAVDLFGSKTEQPGGSNPGGTTVTPPTTPGGNNNSSQITSLTQDGEYYCIASEDELIYFNQNLNTFAGAKIKLTKNLDMSSYAWEPYSADGFTGFYGLFDGQGNTISGLTINSTKSRLGLFGTIYYGGQVQNLTIKSSTIAGATGKAGIICGYLEGAFGKAYNIKNCNVVDCTITTAGTGTVNVGGIAGFAYTSIIIDSCVNNLKIDNFATDTSQITNSCVGGIVGQSGQATIEKCAVIGDSIINAYARGNSMAGGIVGQMTIANSQVSTQPSVSKSFFSGSVVLAGTINSKNSYAGGIVGQQSVGTISNCYNTGHIKSYAKDEKGSAEKITPFGEPAPKFINGAQMKGVAYPGYYVTTNGTGDYNNIAQNSTKTAVKIKAYAGGICGYSDSSATISLCYNTGDITTNGKEYYEYNLVFKYSRSADIISINDLIEAIVYSKATSFRGNICGNSKTLTSCYADYQFNNSGAASTDSFVNKKFILYHIAYGQEKLGVYYDINSSDVFTFGYKNASGTYKELFSTNLESPTAQSETLTSLTLNDIVSANGDVWAVSESVNNGKPYIKDLYSLFAE